MFKFALVLPYSILSRLRQRLLVTPLVNLFAILRMRIASSQSILNVSFPMSVDHRATSSTSLQSSHPILQILRNQSATRPFTVFAFVVLSVIWTL